MHVDWYKNNFDVIGESDLSSVLNSRRPPTERLALITFDDGYRDNLELAVPVLNAASVPAIFYIVTEYAFGSGIPWWDRVAWMVRKASAGASIQYLGQSIQILEAERESAIKSILSVIKEDKQMPLDQRLQTLSESLGIDPIEMPESPMMTRSELLDLIDAGMSVGSHTVSHRLLSHLAVTDQANELTQSKTILETELDVSVSTVAYPVGSQSAYTADTELEAERAGYTAGFSFEYGMSQDPRARRYAIPRYPVDGIQSASDLRYLIASFK